VYKLLLCWRYLLTRYLALACIISVMLGVATLIVVNSVMGGFSTKLKERLHGLLSDVLIEALNFNGFPDPAGKMRRIQESPIGQYVAAMTPTIESFATIHFRYRGEMVVRPVRLIGVDPVGRTRVGGFAEHLVRQKGSATPSFQLDPTARERYERNHPPLPPPLPHNWPAWNPGEVPPPEPPSWAGQPKVPRGIIVGNALVSWRPKGAHAGDMPADNYLLEPGDDIWVTTASGNSGEGLTPVFDRFVICDYFKSEMSEYDSNYVFVPLEYLQHIRAMDDRVTCIQLKLTDFKHAEQVVETLRRLFPQQAGFQVQTWQDKQGPLLAAISVEKGILNILLFLIIAVAGFGILAIFSMIVVEKTRDIGILKALGASNRGVMSIFLGYGLLLGMVGAVLGTALGLTITIYINDIEKLLATITGSDIFPRDVYYFKDIPTDIQPWSILLINLGAVAIAVIFSILPALRAALLQPVRALRYE
jgi:lipoprotein-releasing system permease protein